MLELHEHLERKPANLSGGQRQRVAMGRAIVRQAEAFLFDEPLSNLDAKLRGQMRTEISRLQRRLGITTVYVTHDQTEAMTLGDRVCVLRKGKHPAGRLAARALRAAGQPVRRRLHRLAADELPAGHGRTGNRLKTPFGDIELDERRGQARSPARTCCWSASGRSTSRTPRWSTRPSAPLGVDRSRRGSTSPSGWATRSTPTSRSRRPRRSPPSCATCPASSTATSCAPRRSSPSTRPAGSARAARREFWLDTPQGARVRPARPARTSPATPRPAPS